MSAKCLGTPVLRIVLTFQIDFGPSFESGAKIFDC